MKRNKKLAFNTILFAISNFSSKALAFLLVPFYTAVLTTEQYGTVDLMITANALLVPIITMNIPDAVLRFGLDKDKDRNTVFLNGFVVILAGNFCASIIIIQLTTLLNINEYCIFLMSITFSNSLYSLAAQYCRSQSQNVIFALGGVVQTGILIVSNLVLLLGFSLGINGYLISILLSYVISFLFLFFGGKLYNNLRGRIRWSLIVEMLKYSLPLIPNAVFWWVMNASDKFFIAKMLGVSYNGIYAVSNKLPSLINMISVVFFQAWQLSAIEEVDSDDRRQYYDKIFYYLSSVIFLGMSFVIAILRPLFQVWTHSSYHIGWQYSWILLFATMCMCFSSFWGANLLAIKKSMTILSSTLVGGVTNLLLNAILIPKYGLYGASFATLIGFFLMVVIRIKSAKINLEVVCINRTAYKTIIILVMQVIFLYYKHYQIIELVLFGVILWMKRDVVKDMFYIITSRFRGNRAKHE